MIEDIEIKLGKELRERGWRLAVAQLPPLLAEFSERLEKLAGRGRRQFALDPEAHGFRALTARIRRFRKGLGRQDCH